MLEDEPLLRRRIAAHLKKLGVDEAGTGWLAEALGFGSLTGVALALYRKLRVLFWTALGLVLMEAVKNSRSPLGENAGVPACARQSVTAWLRIALIPTLARLFGL